MNYILTKETVKNMDFQASFLEIVLSLWLTPNLYFKQLPGDSMLQKFGVRRQRGSLMHLETSPASYLSYIWRKRCQQRRLKMNNVAEKAASAQSSVRVPRGPPHQPSRCPKVPLQTPLPPSSQLPYSKTSFTKTLLSYSSHPTLTLGHAGSPLHKRLNGPCLWALRFGALSFSLQ